MMELYMDWTIEQWDEWEARTVTINLDRFEALTTAVSLLAAGRRPNRLERARWASISTDCWNILSPIDAEIDAMEATTPESARG